MMAFVVSLIWRQIGAVGEAVRVLNQEGMLWVSATPVSEAAVTQRLNSLPAVLFENVLKALLPKMASAPGSGGLCETAVQSSVGLGRVNTRRAVA